MNTCRVFLCSTYEDLLDERKAVLGAVQALRLDTISMELFGARGEAPIETCLDEVRQSDIVVILVGHRYGSIVPGLEISFPEAEYREGLKLKRPCLIYLRGDDVPILPRYVETDPNKARLLEQWKSWLLAQHTTAQFSSAEQLAKQVASDLKRAAEALLSDRDGLFELVQHVSLPVRDLERSIAFYRDALGLRPIERPTFPFPGEWFELPGGGQLHLVQNPNGSFRTGTSIEPRDIHFALRASSWRKAFELLVLKNLRVVVDPYEMNNLQLYLLDPDGHVIEVNAPGVPDEVTSNDYLGVLNQD